MASLKYKDCIDCIHAIMEVASKDGKAPIAVSIVDSHGDLVAFGRMDGTFTRSVHLSRNKAFTAVFMGRDTHEFRDMLTRGNIDIVSFGRPGELTALPGGARIMDGATCVGGIGVSGRTSEEDLELARDGLELLKRRFAAQ
jgi:glc operon protein GlcG